VSAALLIRALLLAVVVAADLVACCCSVTSIMALADTTPGDTRTRPAVPLSSAETGAARTALEGMQPAMRMIVLVS
jgi:hypothetical protein